MSWGVFSPGPPGLQIFDILSFALGPNFAPRCPISDSSVSFGIYRPTPSILGHSPRVSSILWSRRPILERFSPIFKGKRRRKRRVGQTGHCSQRRLCWGHTMEAQATRTGGKTVKGKLLHINQSQPQALPNNQMKHYRQLFNQPKPSGALPKVSEQHLKKSIDTA